MSLSRRLLLGRGALGALLAPFVGPAAGSSVGGRLAAGAMLQAGAGAYPPHGTPIATGSSGPAVFSKLWWSRARWQAEDQVLQAGHTLPVDADLASLRSLSPMARQRIMRRRWVDRRVAEHTLWDRAAAIFNRET